MKKNSENTADRRNSQLRDRFIRKDLEQMLKAKNYTNYLFRMVKPHLGRSVVEIGSGIGTFTRKLAEHADTVVAVEPNDYCFSVLGKQFQSFSNIHLLNRPMNGNTAEALRQYSPDTILCMNVLEHIENDYDMICSFYRLLSLRGRIVLVLPAHEWAFGPIDKAVGHFRRYSARQLSAMIEGIGFTVTCQRHFNAIGLAGWIWNAKAAKINKQNDAQITLFDKYIIPAQSLMEKWIRLPFGMSILLVAHKMRTNDTI